MTLRLALAAGAVAVGVAAAPARADVIADGIAAIPGAVEDVRIGGTWQLEGKSGAYRIVIAREGGNQVTARLFVQWVSYLIDGTATVENSIEITELSDLGVDVVDYNSESDADGLSVYIQTLDPNGDVDLIYELFVFSPSEYLFDQASN
jgi:hypothetical protein